MPTQRASETITPTTVGELGADLAQSPGLEPTTESNAAPPPAPQAAAAPTVQQPALSLAEIESVKTELEAKRDQLQPHEYNGLREIVHAAEENVRVPDVIPEWSDGARRARETEQLVKFALAKGVTQERIDHFNRHGTAAELKAWRDLWLAEKRANGRATTQRMSRREQNLAGLAEQTKSGRLRDAARWVIESGLVD